MDDASARLGRRSSPSFGEAAVVWLSIASQSFGGSAAQIAAMHQVLVEERKWLSEERFLHALHTWVLLPGSEALQLLTWVGWVTHGYRGGLVAGGLFLVPGFGALLGLSVVYARYHEVPAVGAALFGLEAAVIAVVLEAVVRIGRRVLTRPPTVLVAVAAFFALLVVPFPLVIAVAALLGAVGARWFPPPTPPTARTPAERPLLDGLLDDGLLPHVRPSPGRDLAVAVAVVAAWVLPTAVLWGTLGGDATFTDVGRFSTSSALVTFGGGYAVLAWAAQQAVEAHHWLVPTELAAALGLAEMAPGPLVQVMQLVGFLAAYRDPGALPPTVAGALGAILAAWTTFVPSFGFALAGGPYIEPIRRSAVLASALRAVTAAVVGVVAHLGVWLGAAVLVPVRPLAIGIALVAAVALLRFRVQRTLVLLVAAMVGWLGWLIGG